MEIQVRSTFIFKIIVSLLVPIIIYWQDLFMVINEALNNDLATHILAIPFLLIYILYRNRSLLNASTSNLFSNSPISRFFPIERIIGILLCLLAYLIKWFGSYTFQPLEYHIASLPLFVAGIILIIFNTQTLRTLIFPIVFLVFLIPPPIRLAQSIGSSLAIFSSQAAYNLLKMMRLPVKILNDYGSPVIVLNPLSGTEIPFAIDIACSGLYSMIGFTIFALFIAYITRGPLKKKLSIFCMGLLLIYALNILRITLIVLIGHYSGPTIALNIFHFLGGWTLIFLGSLVLLIVAEKALKIQIFSVTSNKCTHSNKNEDESFCMDCGRIFKIPKDAFSKTNVLKITFLLIISISLLFIEVPVFTLSKGTAEIFVLNPTGEQTATEILPEIDGYQGRFVYRDVEFEKISGQNASLIFQYVNKTQSRQIIWVGLEISSTKGRLHPWEICLITLPQEYGREPRVTKLDLRDIHLLNNPPLIARYFAFHRKDSNYTQVVLYWYTRSIFKIGPKYQQKWTKISVIEFVNNPQEYKTSEAELLPIAKAIAEYWQPITDWSWVATTIAENGHLLITIATALLLFFIIISLYLDFTMSIRAKHVITQISDPEDCQIINSVKALKKEIVTESKIALKYREYTGKSIDLKRIHKKLVEAEEARLIERKMININDEPYITWKLI